MTELPPICSWCAKAITKEKPAAVLINGHQEQFHLSCWRDYMNQPVITSEELDEALARQMNFISS